MPRTNNKVESWHSQITSDEKSHLTVNKCICLFREEQGNMESKIVDINTGQKISKKKNSSLAKDERILNVVNSYNTEKKLLIEFLQNMSLILNID